MLPILKAAAISAELSTQKKAPSLTMILGRWWSHLACHCWTPHRGSGPPPCPAAPDQPMGRPLPQAASTLSAPFLHHQQFNFPLCTCHILCTCHRTPPPLFSPPWVAYACQLHLCTASSLDPSLCSCHGTANDVIGLCRDLQWFQMHREMY